MQPNRPIMTISKATQFKHVCMYKANIKLNFTAKIISCKALSKEMQEQAMQAIDHEANTCKILNHSNIVSFRKREFIQHHHVMLFDYCNKGNLSDLMKSNPQRIISQTLSLDLLKDIVSGYNYLYSMKIIHRNLSCKSIYVHSHSGDNFVAKIAEFGECVWFGDEAGMESNYCNSMNGHIHYMSPEMLGRECYNYHTDVYSIGVIYFAILFGYYPFAGKNCAEILSLHKIGDVTFKFKQPVYAYSIDFIMNCLALEDKRMTNCTMQNHPIVMNSSSVLKKAIFPANKVLKLNVHHYTIANLKGYISEA